MKDITVYGGPGCPACTTAKQYLDSKGIEYKYLEVGTDITPQEFVEKTNSRSVPVIIIDGVQHIGWNQELFN